MTGFFIVLIFPIRGACASRFFLFVDFFLILKLRNLAKKNYGKQNIPT